MCLSVLVQNCKLYCANWAGVGGVQMLFWPLDSKKKIGWNVSISRELKRKQMSDSTITITDGNFKYDKVW